MSSSERVQRIKRNSGVTMHSASTPKENVVSLQGKHIISLAVAALALPALASAQPSYGQSQPGYAQPAPAPQAQPGYDQPGPGPQDYGQDQGPAPGGQPMQGGSKHGHKAQKSVYPQFRSLEKHIRHTVREERKANTIAKRDAHKLMAQLKQIQAEEMSMYNAHGMNLPADAQAHIQGELTQLAQAVDQTRPQQAPGQPYQGRQ
jgi:hypothetical protein